LLGVFVALIALVGATVVVAAGTAGGVWSGDNGKLVFFKFTGSDEGPIAEIYSMDSDGQHQTNLTAAGGAAGQVDIQPSVSPDGKSIAFTHLDPDTQSAQVWTMKFDGSDRTDVSDNASDASESGPTWSADGTQLLFVRQPAGSFPGDQGGGPASAGGSLWIRNADGSGTPEQLTQGPTDANPVMSNHGTQIAFSRPAKGARHLFIMNADGSGTPTDLGQGAKPDWSPDDSHLVYGQGGGGPIMVVNVADPSDTQTLTEEGNEAPVWSPDGTQIAFQSCAGESGACQIAVMNADGTDAHDVTDDEIGGMKVDWQAKGHETPSSTTTSTSRPPTTTTTTTSTSTGGSGAAPVATAVTANPTFTG